MICPQCHQEIANGGGCPECQGRTPSFRSNGAPTLIRGVSIPEDVPKRRRSDGHAPRLWPLVWLGFALIIIYFFWAVKPTPEYAGARLWKSMLVSKPPLGRQYDGAFPSTTEVEKDRLTVRVPAGRWIDTGIDMCGSPTVIIHAVGRWKTPLGITTGPNGIRGHKRDRLAAQLPYGSLISKVGVIPYSAVGASRVLDRDGSVCYCSKLTNSIGILKLGMNARKSSSVDRSGGAILVTITGRFDTWYAPR